MEIVKIGFKKFEIKEQLGEFTLVLFKNKEYLMKKFQTYSAFCDYLEHYNMIRNMGVKLPKVIAKDKKNNLVVEEYIKGDNVMNLLMKDDLKDEVYERIFMMTFLARTSKYIINFDPSNYIYAEDGILYYMSKEYRQYEPELNFIKEGIRLWFYTKEFMDLLKEKNLPIDNKRIKNDYVINKEIVLKTIKFYR